MTDIPIAIVGIGGIFPEALILEKFWNNILNGRDANKDVPAGRWILDANTLLDKSGVKPDKVYSTRSCFVENFSLDIAGLDIDPTFLSSLDLLNHYVLHAGRNAFSDCRTAHLDLSRVGIIIGNIALPTEKSSAQALDILGKTFFEKIPKLKTNDCGCSNNSVNRYVTGLPAGILAKALGLGGGTYTLDAACASSLYALKLAVDELQTGRADAMLTGGVSRADSLYTQMGFSQLHALSLKGKCTPFDAQSDGLIVGEGAGIVVLKRLDDALNSQDTIYGVIKGIGLSNDIEGNLLAPNSEGQLRSMKPAYDQAKLKPWDIDLIECHATGTPLGDRVEFNSLCQLWKGALKRKNKCVIGSVKSNVGHLLTGAGAAGLIKVLLSLKNEILPPTANFKTPNPDLNVDNSPFEILKEGKKWFRKDDNTPRRAVINAFGFGGINAHVIVEEWLSGTRKSKKTTRPKRNQSTQIPIAIVGMGTYFGPWKNLREFQERILGGDNTKATDFNRQWWGVLESDWFKKSGYNRSSFQGYYIDQLNIGMGNYRIPPNELKEMLPQQLVMLLVADQAFKDANYNSDDGLHTGVYIGLGLDLCTTNFHFRWALYNRLNDYYKNNGSELSESEFNTLLNKMRDAAGPPLNADRTMGALGGIVASRIAREFRVGGPSHTISSEESSGIHALEVACHALQNGEINQALVGAVDLAGDIRSLINTHADRPFSNQSALKPFDINADGTVAGEGAAALILKRLDDAERDGNRVYSVVKGVGSASGPDFNTLVPNTDAYKAAFNRAYSQCEIKPESIQLLEAHGSAYPPEDDMECSALLNLFGSKNDEFSCFLNSVKSDIGHTGAAAGLASIVKVCLCLYQELLPPLRNVDSCNPELEKIGFVFPKASQFWLRNRVDGPRRAGVSCFSMDGNCTHVVLEGCETLSPSLVTDDRFQPLGVRPAGIFAIEGDTMSTLSNRLIELEEFVGNSSSRSIEYWARKWWAEYPTDTKRKLGLAILAKNQNELISLINKALEKLKEDSWIPDAREQIFFNQKPLGKSGQLAFVFPGFGNHFRGMGRDLSAAWPEIFHKQDAENEFLHDQLLPDYFWYDKTGRDAFKNHKAMITGQVFIGTTISDIVRYFGVKPDAMIGYSLGESSGLVALGAWNDRDEMIRRMNASPIFSNELVGECRTVRKSWNIPHEEDVSWTIGMVDCSPQRVEKIISKKDKVYLLIVNTSDECVIGGDNDQVEEAIKSLGCRFLPIYGAPTVHCEVAKAIENEYREFHTLKTDKPKHIRFYSMAWEKSYPISSAKVSDSIQAQALTKVNFPGLIENSYKDGVRLFIEIGPGVSCTRMISSILKDQPHVARSVCYHGQDSIVAILRLLANLIAERSPVNLANLYGHATNVLEHQDGSDFDKTKYITVSTDAGGFVIPDLPNAKISTPVIKQVISAQPKDLEIRPKSSNVFDPVIQHMIHAEEEKIVAHQEYLDFSNQLSKTISSNISYQMQLIAVIANRNGGEALSQEMLDQLKLTSPLSNFDQTLNTGKQTSDISTIQNPDYSPIANDESIRPALDRDMCMEFAIGSIGKVLGPEFNEVDTYPTRVRLPDEPLMLVDRILEINGEIRSMTSGRVVTEHDIHPNSWYLDNGRIPTCIAVEAGQADLFLSGYLGIDFESKGLAVYRLLDAEVTFHSSLPGPGKVIHYDIKIDNFFKQGDTYLFRFNFESTVDGKPLLTMENGCAGFFTQSALDAGKGIIKTEFQKKKVKGIIPDDWSELVPMVVESYSDDQIAALRIGDFEACFGHLFSGIILNDPLTIPSGKMKLVDRVLELDPKGGRFGLGIIKAEADIHPDDWFLICHFVDDKVMPGTLMYECCLHTLRIYLMRMGWIGEKVDAVCEPVTGIRGRLKCRGQVLQSTKKVIYEISIKELGYDPEPYAIVDALMFADGKAIVEITNMSVRLSGLTRQKIETLWKSQTAKEKSFQVQQSEIPIFDRDRILAFAIGKPSEAFGEPYKIFDEGRKIARLPGPPYQFLDRIIAINAEQWKMVGGGEIIGEYDVPPDEWYFESNVSGMPFSVLLEIALQPCGWLAAYIGSALTSDVDLKFRNLGGSAVQYLPINETAGILSIEVKITSVSTSGGMVIQHFDFHVKNQNQSIYKGKTYFGFFTKAALSDQVGIIGAKPYIPDEKEIARGSSFPFPENKPFPDEMLRMIDHVSLLVKDGGPAGKGFIRGIKKVNPDEWFFKAHFYQDPVCPGSLGLESFIQLLQVFAVEYWGNSPNLKFENIALNQEHIWIYRGQIIPTDDQVTVEACITDIDEGNRIIYADGFLSVDGRNIYEMKQFTLKYLG